MRIVHVQKVLFHSKNMHLVTHSLQIGSESDVSGGTEICGSIPLQKCLAKLRLKKL